jgi:hypothetical protein
MSASKCGDGLVESFKLLVKPEWKKTELEKKGET